MTDYWEYRGFQKDVINASIPKSNTTHLIFPPDTGTYFMVRYFWDPAVDKIQEPAYPGDRAYYQPPATLHKYYGYETVDIPFLHFNGTHNVTLKVQETRVKRYQDVIVLFQQYGNLFRDCDNLEGEFPTVLIHEPLEFVLILH